MTQALNLANFANNLNTSGQTSNAGLQNSSVTVTAGTGMSGGGAVALGSSVTLTNAGVTSLTAGTGISLSGSTGAVTVTNSSSYPGARGQSFTANGTFTIPTGITALKIIVQGGGGGGGGAQGIGSSPYPGGGSGGGGGGGTAIAYLTGLTPGNTLTVTVGGAGSGSGGSSNGGSGGNSTVASGTQTITTITGGGGGGGLGGYAYPQAYGGAGGSATNGTINITGGAGTGMSVGSVNANCSYNVFPSLSGQGGNTLFGFGGPPQPGSTNGATGNGYGCGGSGVYSFGSTPYTGGAGKAGIVIFEW